jgi:ABC-type oligopeptide transport system substrate-binding subunit
MRKTILTGKNPEYSRLLDQSFYDATAEKRAETLTLAESLLLEEMPLAPLYHWQTSFMMKDHLDLKDLKPSGSLDYARIVVKEKK